MTIPIQSPLYTSLVEYKQHKHLRANSSLMYGFLNTTQNFMDEFDINDIHRAWNHGCSWTSNDKRDLVNMIEDPLDAKQVLSFASTHGRKAYSTFNKFVEIMWLNKYYNDSELYDKVVQVTQKYI